MILEQDRLNALIRHSINYCPFHCNVYLILYEISTIVLMIYLRNELSGIYGYETREKSQNWKYFFIGNSQEKGLHLRYIARKKAISKTLNHTNTITNDVNWQINISTSQRPQM